MKNFMSVLDFLDFFTLKCKYLEQTNPEINDFPRSRTINRHKGDLWIGKIANTTILTFYTYIKKSDLPAINKINIKSQRTFFE